MKTCALILSSFWFLWAIPAKTCTGIIKKTQEGSYVYGRTLEFGAAVLSFDLAVVPRNYPYTGQVGKNKAGLSWKAKYGHVGFSPFKLPLIADGINETGLACGAFLFPGYAEYQKMPAKDLSRSLSCLDLVSWILGSFSKVSQVREALARINVVGASLPGFASDMLLHYIVVDEAGDSIVIEYTEGRLHIYDHQLGTITNAPEYHWHLTNMRNYIGLSAQNRPPWEIDGEKLFQLGQGSGGLGLPGDFMPTSRFVRATFLSQFAYPGANGKEGIAGLFHILNNFDIPKGAVLEVHKNGQVVPEETQWTSAADLKNRTYYFHTAKNRSVRMIDLKEVNLASSEMRRIFVDDPEIYQNLSERFR